jgi:death-on-curing protein
VTSLHWFTEEEALALHDLLLAHYGGACGVRDAGLLSSALARPRQLSHYGTPGLAELAAAYAFGVVRNHPFVDGNKRTGFMLAAGFIERNGAAFNAPEAEAVTQTLGLAAGQITEADYARWLAANSRLPPLKSRSPRAR